MTSSAAGDAGAAIILTCCSPCVLILSVILLFWGELQYVYGQADVEYLKKHAQVVSESTTDLRHVPGNQPLFVQNVIGTEERAHDSKMSAMLTPMGSGLRITRATEISQIEQRTRKEKQGSTEYTSYIPCSPTDTPVWKDSPTLQFHLDTGPGRQCTCCTYNNHVAYNPGSNDICNYPLNSDMGSAVPSFGTGSEDSYAASAWIGPFDIGQGYMQSYATQAGDHPLDGEGVPSKGLGADGMYLNDGWCLSSASSDVYYNPIKSSAYQPATNGHAVTGSGIAAWTNQVTNSCTKSSGGMNNDVSVWKTKFTFVSATSPAGCNPGPKGGTPPVGCSRQQVTALGEKNGSDLKEWKSSNGNTYRTIRLGTKSSDEMCDAVLADVTAQVWVVRIMTFFLMWISFRMALTWVDFLKDIMLDTMECCRGSGFVDNGMRMLENDVDSFVDCALCYIACVPAVLLWFVTFAIAWVTFRPQVSIPIFIVFCGYMAYARQRKGRGGYQEFDNQQQFQQVPTQGAQTQYPPQQQYNQPVGPNYGGTQGQYPPPNQIPQPNAYPPQNQAGQYQGQYPPQGQYQQGPSV